ncbi:MAG TPA: DUF1707 domain-containing protein, partial [Trebonia sp.]|nr:DUF1707 domain-containing protein [Trebonia sp.]
MADVGGNKTPGDQGHLRAAHADRERAIGLLKFAFVQGMLDKDEFDLRVGQAFASRTYAELAAITRDLPAPRPVPAVPDEGWLTVRRAVIVSAWLVVPTALATVLSTPFADRYKDPAFIVL